MKPYLETNPFSITHLESTESTNKYLRQLCEKKEMEEYSIVTTDFQIAGRGQRGNFWESEKKENLLFSILLYPQFLPAQKQFLLSQIISLAIQEELSKYVNSICIKWPNDIYWKNKKICGILIENDLSGNKLQKSIIGIGININQEIFTSTAPNPVSLKQITCETYNVSEILYGILTRIYHYYNSLKQNYKLSKQNFCDEITRNYHKALFRKEGYHLYEDNTGRFWAEIVFIDPLGILTLRDENGKERKYAFKEVSYVKEEEDRENFPTVSLNL